MVRVRNDRFSYYNFCNNRGPWYTNVSLFLQHMVLGQNETTISPDNLTTLDKIWIPTIQMT